MLAGALPASVLGLVFGPLLILATCFTLTLMRDNVLAQALHQHFLDCSQYAKILARTAKQSRQELHITGLSDSAKSLILSLLHHEVGRPFFRVAADHNHAARYQQEISNLSRYKVLIYPASEVSPYEQVLHS